MARTHQYSLDSRLEVRNVGLAALTANTTLFTHNQRGNTRTAYVAVINIESIKISANNEEYRFIMEVSNDDFSTVETAAILSLGATEARLGGGPDNVVGDAYDFMWCTEVNGTQYKSWRIRLVVAGTSPSIGLSAFVGNP